MILARGYSQDWYIYIYGILTINTYKYYKPEILEKFHSVLGPFSPVGQWDGHLHGGWCPAK